MSDTINEIAIEYQQLLNGMNLSPCEEDYARFKTKIPLLQEMAKIDGSAISVFDMASKQHIFASYNFESLLGKKAPHPITMEYFDSVIHPEDYVHLLKVGVEMLKYNLSLDNQSRPFVRLFNEYRIKAAGNKWIKVIEQHKALELDPNGEVWLSISMLDVSPDQNLKRPVISRVFNSVSGESFLIDYAQDKPYNNLTRRESEILGLMDKGLLSKEISHHLNISVHTVNTHRQRILEKTNSSNSIEALNYAKQVGLI